VSVHPNAEQTSKREKVGVHDYIFVDEACNSQEFRIPRRLILPLTTIPARARQQRAHKLRLSLEWRIVRFFRTSRGAKDRAKIERNFIQDCRPASA
jgi:hypothetical protein